MDIMAQLAPACIARFTTDMTAYGGRCGVFFGMISFATLVSAPIAGGTLYVALEQCSYLLSNS